MVVLATAGICKIPRRPAPDPERAIQTVPFGKTVAPEVRTAGSAMHSVVEETKLSRSSLPLSQGTSLPGKSAPLRRATSPFFVTAISPIAAHLQDGGSGHGWGLVLGERMRLSLESRFGAGAKDA